MRRVLAHASFLSLITTLLLGGCASRGTPPVASTAEAAPSDIYPAVCQRNTHEQLQGTLWMQTAAEYRVLGTATYRAATAALARALADPAWTAATEQTSDPSRLPPAVILDLDETVLDNSRFQGEQVLRCMGFTPALWTEWVDREDAGLVPGAAEFLAAARARGIAVFFVTNRTRDEEPATVDNLRALGIAVTPDEVLASGENGWTSDKTARRRFVAEKHRVLLLVGDDLGDFIPARLTPEERGAAAEKHAAWWGERWFLLPNPMYGSWDRALYGFESLADEEILRRKRALVRGFEVAEPRQ